MKPWTEWKERCAVALCSADTQHTLLAFGGMRFRTLAQRCLSHVNVDDVEKVMLPDRDAWHLLETHMTLSRSSNGKAYKAWLFDRTAGTPDSPFDVVQGGATLLMRWVVREHLRQEYSPADHVSANRTRASDEGAPIEEAWLPADSNTHDAIAQREIEHIAMQEATACFDRLAERARLIVAARRMHIPFTSPPLLALANCSNSAMSYTFRKEMSQLLKQIATDYTGEDRATQVEIALLTFDGLADRCVAWALASERYGPILSAQSPAPAH